ncbi:MAG: orotate phosphoribosyltransferase [Verrucomicrobiaceae bacterium]|nr:orotate phosphoribosyltransferase [Verrucomicrobiaceae bacterium]
MADNPREQLKQLLLDKSVRTGEFTLASGKKSDLYVDCRVSSFDARGARLIGEVGWEKVSARLQAEGLSAAGIGGMTLGADPISLAIGMESARQQPDSFLQVFTVRKEAKQYGVGRRIEGNFQPGDAVVVVDDVITTGGSTLKAIDAIQAEGGEVLFAFVLVDREEGGRQALEERGIAVVPLFTRTDLVGKSG